MPTTGSGSLVCGIGRVSMAGLARASVAESGAAGAALFFAWPRESDEDQRRFEAWHAEYLDAQADFATCRFVAAVGDGRIHPEAQQIVEVHDALTRSDEQLELA